MLKCIQVMLAIPAAPEEIKWITRRPIPKKAVGETRPLTLCDDIYSFITGEITFVLIRALEQSGVLPKGLRAYRPAMGTDQIILTDMAVKEDALEFNKLLARTEEDKENIYDRISLEIQVISMLRLGFPQMGYVECKVDDMMDRNVKIVTRQCTAFSKFTCGLPQGSPLSCAIVNLIVALKFSSWMLDPDN